MVDRPHACSKWAIAIYKLVKSQLLGKNLVVEGVIIYMHNFEKIHALMEFHDIRIQHVGGYWGVANVFWILKTFTFIKNQIQKYKAKVGNWGGCM